PSDAADFQTVFWEQRGLDVLIQMVLIFSGVIGILSLLGEQQEARPSTTAQNRVKGGQD
ncbi:MAG: hypothetical protein GYB68_00420, partial [Chloroflexi bacterium]|nr:hypothetical protein [Chloroflexota bacterium]